jgi:hypothetical protein
MYTESEPAPHISSQCFAHQDCTTGLLSAHLGTAGAEQLTLHGNFLHFRGYKFARKSIGLLIQVQLRERRSNTQIKNVMSPEAGETPAYKI